MGLLRNGIYLKDLGKGFRNSRSDFRNSRSDFRNSRSDFRNSKSRRVVI